MRFSLLISFLLFSHLAFPQRLMERNTMIVPLADSISYDQGTGISFAHSLSGWAGFGNYLASSDESHEWVHELGATVELMRFSNRATLGITTSIEFIADPFNNINFNPRSIWWSEGLFYMRKTEKGFWRAGYYHRCKHDIDNLSLGEERRLIFGSLHGEYFVPVRSDEESEFWYAIGTEIYTIRQDDRVPFNPAPESLNHMKLLASFSLKFHHLKRFSNPKFGWYANGFLQPNFYSGNEGLTDRFSDIDRLNASFGLSAGLALIGNGQIRIGFNYEYHPDTTVPILPVGSHLLSFGIRGLSMSQVK